MDGGDSATLTVTATSANTFCRYRCVVTSDGNSVTSESALLQAYSTETISDNLAVEGTVTLSTGQNAAVLNNGITDPAVDTVQTADNPVNPAVTVTFPETTAISRVVLYAGKHGGDTLPTAYTVEVSDGTQWKTVAVNTDYRRRADAVLTIDFSTVTALAVRVTADRLQGYSAINGCTRLGLAEVEVYRVGAEIVRGGISQQSITADSDRLLENRVNLAQGKSYFAYNPTTGVKDSAKTLPASLTDSKIVGVNATTADTKSHEFITSFKWTYQEYTNPDDAADAWIVIDLGEAKTVGNVLIGQGQDNHINGKMWRGYVYVGDSVDTLFTDRYKVAEYHYETADALPTAVSDLGVLMAADRIRSGRYVGIRVPMNGPYWGASAIGFRTSEIGIYAPDAYVDGAQIRQREDGDTFSDLRFGVVAQVSGAAYRTVAGNPYHADLTDAVFTLSGTPYKVAEMGTLVARESLLDAPAETALTLSSGEAYVRSVPAEKLYSVEDSTVTYTAVVTDIPMQYRDEVLVARPYVRFLLSGSEDTADAVYAVYYGDITQRTVTAVMEAQ